ncbi:MAG: tripartite tricarboxylate transporter substrate-binding protein [Rhodovarius sp.]|nr:tripartite tricarboxylate transporter substrate-binding protein [Rhodovarius sp.]MCX7932897.1 tripartite tricarboxylate transporter substrate-binding protein [Rhodovarius sp.]MDW8313635.1 tripartite tricarboxylate transporter substrate-binding protein [Rhodovarius sp.]
MAVITRRALAPIGAGLLAAPALAQGWPAGTIRIVVGFPPGGSTDAVSRLLAPHLQAAFGQPVVVENRPGASGNLAAAAIARGPTDGSQWLVVFDTHAVNPALIPNPGFDARRDLAPILLIGTAPNLINVHRDRPWRSMQEVVAAARARPDTITFGTIGNGSLAHLLMVLAQRNGDFRLVHVPYRGGGPLATAAMAGETDLAVATGTIFVPHFQQGVLRPVAVSSRERSRLRPEVPTLAEAGIPGVDARAFWGVLCAAGVPRPIQQRMEAALREAIALPPVQQRLTEVMGIELALAGPEEFGRFLEEQMETWARVVRENDIRPD